MYRLCFLPALVEQPFSNNMVPFKSLFIDDLCVDRQARGQHIGEGLFEYVKQQAKELGCYESNFERLGRKYFGRAFL